MPCGVAHETELDRAVRRLREDDSSFTELGLYGEDIGDEGVSVLADVLRVNTSLKMLDLWSNSIGDKGVSVLADALRVNTSLRVLNLNSNSIGEEGVIMLADALRVNTSLEWLVLSYNNDIIGVSERRVRKLTEINREAESPHEAFGQKVELILDSDGWDDTSDEYYDSDGWDNSSDEDYDEIYSEREMLRAEHDAIEDAVSLALTGLERFSEWDQRREILHSLLGSPKHGKDVAASIDLAMWKNLYRHAVKCGAAPALVNLLRAQPSLCEHRSEEEQGGLYPFMLLATMPTAEVGGVFEVLLMKPDLVGSAIKMV